VWLLLAGSVLGPECAKSLNLVEGKMVILKIN
jgi:hypothetical protein